MKVGEDTKNCGLGARPGGKIVIGLIVDLLAFDRKAIIFAGWNCFTRFLRRPRVGWRLGHPYQIGTPVIFRINRQLIAIECPLPTEEWMNNVVKNIIPIHLKKQLEEDREIDFSYYDSGRGTVPHEPFSATRPVCLAMRYVKTKCRASRNWACRKPLRSRRIARAASCWWPVPPAAANPRTLAAMIEHINANFKKHIVTLEDPIEFVFEDNQSVIEQREVGLDTALLSSSAEARAAAGPGHHHAG